MTIKQTLQQFKKLAGSDPRARFAILALKMAVGPAKLRQNEIKEALKQVVKYAAMLSRARVVK